ncbi:FYVE zinc finger domain-containing protein [Toxoplasma gondii VEG]|uniref:FYVE zinc finger domain-containing protein n=6 Tax=Toxoplasma gondii TaxID=5811 RepID=V5AXG5_TOXGV|nr:FYVE zinc finger domain-containing protein [Toxoplasma gondii VEG]
MPVSPSASDPPEVSPRPMGDAAAERERRQAAASSSSSSSSSSTSPSNSSSFASFAFASTCSSGRPRVRRGGGEEATEKAARETRKKLSPVPSDMSENENPRRFSRARDSEPTARVAELPRGSGEPDEGRNVDWVPSDEVTCCSHCGSLFSVTHWKHHCRACGKVFCGECSTTRIRLPDLGYFEKVRVCDDCALARASSHTLSLQEDLDVKEQINANLKLALEEKTKQLEGFRSFLLEVEGLLLSGTQRSLCFSTGRTPGDPPSVSTHAAQGAGWTSEDEFSLLMRQSENGLRQLTQRLQQYEEDFEDVRAQLEALESERDEHRSHAYELERCLHASRVEMTQMKEVAADREALRAVVEEQKRELEEQRRQLVGLQQRCVTLESKSAAAQSPSRSRSTGRGDTAASLASTVEPYTWRGSGSDRGRGASAGVSPGDTSILKGSFFGRDPSDLSRRPVIVGRTDDLDDFAVAFTVADGLGDSQDRFHGSWFQSLWVRCRRCCCRRRRRYFVGGSRSACVIQ